MAGDATSPRYGVVHMDVEVGERLGPYRLLERIGEGGMGVVHLARDPEGRVVAIKVLRAEVAGDATARRRLAREVETMRRVHSPYVAEVVDADVTGDTPYVVTQYVPGLTLDEFVAQRGPLQGQVLTRLAGGLAKALSAVHAAGVVHRDLKPGNVMLLDGDPVIIDFGIAQAVDTTRLTQTGMFIGTPGYLPPEAIQGTDIGPASDIHAWAATVAFAATGRPPFGAGSYEAVFFRIIQGQYDLAGVTGPLLPLLRAAFAANPRDRPPAAWLGDHVAGVGDGIHDGAAAATPPLSAPLPAATPPRGNDSYSDILTPVDYGPPESPVRPPPSSRRERPPPRPGYHPLLCLALLAIAVGWAATLPVIGTLAAVCTLIVLRAADSAQRRLAMRRYERGPSASDVVMVTLATPWGLVRGAMVTLLLAPIAAALALLLGVVLAYALRGVTLDTVGAYAAAVFVGLMCAGPGTRPIRRQVNRTVSIVARGRREVLIVGVVLGVLAAIAISGALSQAAVWWPLRPPEQMLTDLAANARGDFGDWLRDELPDWR